MKAYNFHNNIDEIPYKPNYTEKELETHHPSELVSASLQNDLLVAYELLRMACNEINQLTPDDYNNDVSMAIQEYFERK
jgi:hypothetical protein